MRHTSTPYSCWRPLPRFSPWGRQILESLSCSRASPVQPTQRGLRCTNSLATHTFCVESALRAASKTDEPILDVLRMAPILSFSTDEQYSAATLAKISSLEQSLMHQNTASALRTRGGKKGQQSPQNRTLDPPRVAPMGVVPGPSGPEMDYRGVPDTLPYSTSPLTQASPVSLASERHTKVAPHARDSGSS